MKSSRWQLLVGLLVVPAVMMLAGLGAGPAWAGWPQKPITVYVGWSAGGSSTPPPGHSAYRWRRSWGRRYW